MKWLLLIFQFTNETLGFKIPAELLSVSEIHIGLILEPKVSILHYNGVL